MISVSLIIPTLNEASQIAHAVERAWKTDANQVVVADGGSTDATVDLCHDLNCQLVESAPGRGTQLNAGAKIATGEVLLFLHADNWLVENGCEQIRDQLTANPGMLFGGFQQSIENTRPAYRWIETGNAWRVRWRGLVYGDQAFFIRRETFDQIGGFPEIPIMEDLEISRRLKKFGKPSLLTGPTFVNDRRWRKNGILRQTLTNWWLSSRFLLGSAPTTLTRQYRRHDQD